MKQLKYVYALLFSLMLLSLLGCAPTPTRESTGEYFDDTVITAKAKAAILDQPTLKVTEIKVGKRSRSGAAEWLREFSD